MTPISTELSLHSLLQLASFARYLLEEKLDTFIDRQLQFASEMDIPLLRFFQDLSRTTTRAVVFKTNTEFLTYLAENNAAQQIEASMQQWQMNRLPVVDKNAIASEDILLINYLRKKTC